MLSAVKKIGVDNNLVTIYVNPSNLAMKLLQLMYYRQDILSRKLGRIKKMYSKVGNFYSIDLFISFQTDFFLYYTADKE